MIIVQSVLIRSEHKQEIVFNAEEHNVRSIHYERQKIIARTNDFLMYVDNNHSKQPSTSEIVWPFSLNFAFNYTHVHDYIDARRTKTRRYDESLLKPVISDLYL